MVAEKFVLQQGITLPKEQQQFVQTAASETISLRCPRIAIGLPKHQIRIPVPPHRVIEGRPGNSTTLSLGNLKRLPDAHALDHHLTNSGVRAAVVATAIQARDDLELLLCHVHRIQGGVVAL